MLTLGQGPAGEEEAQAGRGRPGSGPGGEGAGQAGALLGRGPCGGWRTGRGGASANRVEQRCHAANRAKKRRTAFPKRDMGMAALRRGSAPSRFDSDSILLVSIERSDGEDDGRRRCRSGDGPASAASSSPGEARAALRWAPAPLLHLPNLPVTGMGHQAHPHLR